MNKFILDNEPKIETGFTVPDNYFENFEVRIPAEKTRKKSKVYQFYAENKVWILSSAALLALLFTLIFQSANPTEEVYATEIENHILYHSTLSDDDIVNLLDEESISNIKVTSAVDAKEIEETLMEESNLEAYITN